MQNILTQLKHLPPWGWGVLGVGVVAAIAAYRKSLSSTTGTDSVSAYQDPNSNAAAGSNSGGSSNSDAYNKALIDAILAGNDALYQKLGGLITAAHDEDMQNHSAIVGSMTDKSQYGVEAQPNTLKGEVVRDTVVLKPNEVWAPTSKVIGGTGGGITTGTRDQLNEFNSGGAGTWDSRGIYNAGGSRNTGGNYSMDSRGSGGSGSWHAPSPPAGSVAAGVKSAFDAAGGGLAGAQAVQSAMQAAGIW